MSPSKDNVHPATSSTKDKDPQHLHRMFSVGSVGGMRMRPSTSAAGERVNLSTVCIVPKQVVQAFGDGAVSYSIFLSFCKSRLHTTRGGDCVHRKRAVQSLPSPLEPLFAFLYYRHFQATSCSVQPQTFFTVVTSTPLLLRFTSRVALSGGERGRV